MSSKLIYKTEEEEILISLGFQWDEANKEWFKDKNHAGRASSAVYIDHEINYFIFVLRETDDEGKETYERFMNINDLRDYFT